MRRAVRLLVATSALAAAPAAAQPAREPILEVGGQVSALGSAVPQAGPIIVFGAGVGTTLNLARGLGVDLQVEMIAPNESASTAGLYVGQLRWPIGSRTPERSLFVTFGLAGAVVHNSHQERRIARPDGSIVVHPGSESFRIYEPRLITGGIARRQRFAACCSHTVAAQAYVGRWGLGVRASFAVAFGLGGSR